MNRINPKKLLHSKWTAVMPIDREKHFIVTDIDFEEDICVFCMIEAVMSKRPREIDWKELKDASKWKMGWK
ncbi:TIGR02450 family Trp-rich protein [Vibrio maerlii]|uniref:TIGR02450 family Trp-rich protein n=1 Tax=Vibrio maerlii TaxID=2231648 RepID=UPI000E3BFAF4|nr:TIGR02450 family Trp-rich protein [Vibrio maerlii]